MDDIVRFEAADARTFHWGGMYGRIVTNPLRRADHGAPGGGGAVPRLRKGVGQVPGDLEAVSVVLPSTEFGRTFGKKADKKRKLYNGMLKCDLFMYLG